MVPCRVAIVDMVHEDGARDGRFAFGPTRFARGDAPFGAQDKLKRTPTAELIEVMCI